MPARLAGKVYLAGPYKGAPLSLAVVTPAVSGPFDLGTVVVRIALNVDPETTAGDRGLRRDPRRVRRGQARHPHDRPQPRTVPSSCTTRPTATRARSTGTIKGGGSDPTNPAAFSSYPFSTPYQATGCSSLAFKPKLQTKLLGGRSADQASRAPEDLKAILEAREGDANIAAHGADAASRRPSSSTRPTSGRSAPARSWPRTPARATSVYGKATAISPLLNEPLTGPVYLVPRAATSCPIWSPICAARSRSSCTA